MDTISRRDFAELLAAAGRPRFVKAVAEQRYVLGIAYQAGRDPKIRRGMDGLRDYFTPAELEKAAWSFMADGGRQIGIEHIDGTIGAARPVESFIWRWDPTPMTAVDGTRVLVKSGDWLLGAICSPVAWALVKSGQVTGWSPQGVAKRRPPAQVKEIRHGRA